MIEKLAPPKADHPAIRRRPTTQRSVDGATAWDIPVLDVADLPAVSADSQDDRPTGIGSVMVRSIPGAVVGSLLMEIVTIRKRKRPAGTGVWSGYSLAEDEAGLWVYTPAGSAYLGHDGVDFQTCEVAQDPQGNGRDSLVLLPGDQWFVAHFIRGGRLLAHVDVATPPVYVDGVWSYDDLELDPYLTADGDFGVEDEDEFLRACDRGLMTGDEREAAIRSVGVIFEQMGRRDAPLSVAGQNRLLEACALQLPPVHPVADRWRVR